MEDTAIAVLRLVRHQTLGTHLRTFAVQRQLADLVDFVVHTDDWQLKQQKRAQELVDRALTNPSVPDAARSYPSVILSLPDIFAQIALLPFPRPFYSVLPD